MTIWKTEYVVTVDGDEDDYYDDHDEAVEAARNLSVDQPDSDVTVVRLEHHLTDRTELETFSAGVEAQEED